MCRSGQCVARISVCVCAPYVKCCVGSVTGQGTRLAYLTFLVSPSAPMSRSESTEGRMYSHACLQHASVSSLRRRRRCKTNAAERRGETRASDARRERGHGGEVQAEVHGLPPVKARRARRRCYGAHGLYAGKGELILPLSRANGKSNVQEAVILRLRGCHRTT